MSTKRLELNVDAAVLRDAQHLADSRTQSLEALVNDALVAHLKNATNPCPTFAQAMDEVVHQHAELLSRLAK
ncbi:MAG: hypothetical protein R3B07_02320 [Polyangiaceae bacterium]